MERESRVPMKMGDFSLMDSEFNNIKGREEKYVFLFFYISWTVPDLTQR